MLSWPKPSYMDLADSLIIAFPIFILFVTVLYYGLKESFDFYGNPFIDSHEKLEFKFQPKKRQMKKNPLIVNWKIIIPILLVYLLIQLVPLGVFPDKILALKTPDRCRLILRTILLFEGSLLGLFIAITVLTYNNSKEHLGKAAMIQMFSYDNSLLDYFHGLIISILITFFSFLSIKSEVTDQSVSVVYLSCFLFVLLICFLIFIVIRSISGISNVRIASNIVNNITPGSLQELDTSPDQQSDADFAGVVEANAVYNAGQVLRKSLQGDDPLVAQVVFRTSIEKSIELLGNNPTHSECNNVIEKFNIIWSSFLHKCVETENFHLLLLYRLLAHKYYQHWFINSIPLKYLEPHFEIMSEVTRALVKHKQNDVLNHVLWSSESHLINFLVEQTGPVNRIGTIVYGVGDLYDLERDRETLDLSPQWNIIMRSFTNLFIDPIKWSIEFDNKESFNSTALHISTLVDSIDSSNVEEPKKHVLIMILVQDFFYNYKVALEKGLFKSSDGSSFLDPGRIYNLIDKNYKFYPFVLESFADLVIEITSSGYLGTFYYYTFNFGSFVRFCVERYNEDERFEKSFKYIMKLIDRLREIMENSEYNYYKQYVKMHTEVNGFPKHYLSVGNSEDENYQNILNQSNALKAKFLQLDDAEAMNRANHLPFDV